jgi:hypothetical protein
VVPCPNGCLSAHASGAAENLGNVCQVHGFFARHFSLCRQSRTTTRGGTILRTKRLPKGLLLPLACLSTMVSHTAYAASASQKVGTRFFLSHNNPNIAQGSSVLNALHR